MRKRFLSLIMATVMVFALFSTAFAAETTPDVFRLKIKQTGAVQHYRAYKIMDVISTAPGEGETESDLRYTYLASGGSVNDALIKVIDTATGKVTVEGDNTVYSADSLHNMYYEADGTTVKADLREYDRAVYDYIYKQGSVGASEGYIQDHTNSKYWTSEDNALKFARAMYEAIISVAGGIGNVNDQASSYYTKGEGDSYISSGTNKQMEVAANNAADTENKFSEFYLEPGYYLFEQVEESSYAQSRSLIILDTLHQHNDLEDDVPTLVINPKVDKPQVNKDAQSADAYTHVLPTDSDSWYENVVANGDENVKFRLIGTLPKTYQQYKQFFYEFEDTLQNMTMAKNDDGEYIYKVYLDFDGNIDDKIKDVDFTLAANKKYEDDRIDITALVEALDNKGINPTNPAKNAESGQMEQTVKFTIKDLRAAESQDKDKNGIYNEKNWIDKIWAASKTGDCPELTCNARIMVIYEAVLTGKDAIIGGNGNPNEVFVNYSSNPEWSGTPGDPNEPKEPTPKDYAFVFTFEADIDKITMETGSKTLLAGAEFELYRFKAVNESDVSGTDEITATGTWETVNSFDVGEGGTWSETDGKWVSGTMEFNYKSLGDGLYKLHESKIPDGYNGASDVYFLVTSEKITDEETKKETVGNVTFTTLSMDDHPAGEATSGTWKFKKVAAGDNTFSINMEINAAIGNTEIENKPGSLLPSTGGMGTTILYIGGGILMLAAVAALIVLKRKKSEDIA